MKNLFKFGFLALAISLSVVACDSNKKADSATDSTTVDTAVVADTAVVETPKADTTKTDTAKTDTAKKTNKM
ncbi:MAG: hypothetical protein WBP45_14725 [Daejeonella sp.]